MTHEKIAGHYVYRFEDERIRILDIHTQEQRVALNASDASMLLSFLYEHHDELDRLIHYDEAGRVLSPGDPIVQRPDLRRMPGSIYYDPAHNVFYGVENGIVHSVGKSHDAGRKTDASLTDLDD